MHLTNGTKMQAAYTTGMRPDGRELLVVVVKGTFTIPAEPDVEPDLADEQVPLVTADVFTGEPGYSAPLCESDFAAHKPLCDVLLNGSAYAPGGRPAEIVPVALRVGVLEKGFNVVGNRAWRKGLLGVGATKPEPFVRMPISYDNAFGGVDRSHPDQKKHRWYAANHAGRGYHENTAAEHIDGKPLPNTEEFGDPVRSPRGRFRPMAFGPVGRAWGDRPKLAGTYDQAWQDNVFPFLPSDFQDAYYQSAPTDQQIAYLQGGERVELVNVTPRGSTTFRVPKVEMPVEFFLRAGGSTTQTAAVDTLMIEPDLGRFTMCWRASLPLKRNVFEVLQIVSGRMPPAWYRARERGKAYYPSLGRLVTARRAARDDQGVGS